MAERAKRRQERLDDVARQCVDMAMEELDLVEIDGREYNLAHKAALIALGVLAPSTHD
jgi:hypothetical protein